MTLDNKKQKEQKSYDHSQNISLNEQFKFFKVNIQCQTLSTNFRLKLNTNIFIKINKVINISTSAQICISTKSDIFGSIELPKSVTCFPFFDNKILLVSASLNGGNVLEKFVDMLTDWNQKLGIEMDREKIWLNLIEQAKNSNFSLEISPLFYAERHDKLAYGSMGNLRHDNLNIGNMFGGLCLGLIKNLHSMMNKELVLKLKCDRIVATGGAITRNSVLKHCLETEFDYLPLVYKNSTDAAYGSAIFVRNLI